MANAQARFRQTAPDRLEIKKGGGCIGLFGLPFLLAGIFMLLITIGLVPLSNASEVPWWGYVMILFMGLVFSGVGSALVFGRSWVTIDRRKRRVWIAKGLVRPMSGAMYDLDDYHSIVLRLDRSDSDSPDHYPIVLVSRNSGAELPLNDLSFYGDAHEEALMLMNFLKLPLSDRSTDNAVEMIPGEPVTSVKRASKPPPDSVPELHCRVEEDERMLRIAFQGGPIRTGQVVTMLFPLLIFVYFGSRFGPILFSSGTPLPVTIFFAGFMTLFLLIGPLGGMLRVLLLSRLDTLILTINHGVITLESRGLISRKRLNIKAEDVIGFDFSTPQTMLSRDQGMPQTGPGNRHYPTHHGGAYVPDWAYKLSRLVRSKGVVIKSRSAMHYVGAGLPDEQVEYLHHLISDAFLRLNPPTRVDPTQITPDT